MLFLIYAYDALLYSCININLNFTTAKLNKDFITILLQSAFPPIYSYNAIIEILTFNL